MFQSLLWSLHSIKTFATTHTSVSEVNCSQKKPVKIVWQRLRNIWAKWNILLNHKQSGSFPMRKTFAKIKSTTHRITDGWHTVQRILLVSCGLNFPKLWWFSVVCPLRMMWSSAFFPGVLNSDAYVELLNTVFKPWITRVANGRPYATLLGKVKNGCRQIFTTTPVPMFCLQTPQILTP